MIHVVGDSHVTLFTEKVLPALTQEFRKLNIKLTWKRRE